MKSSHGDDEKRKNRRREENLILIPTHVQTVSCKIPSERAAEKNEDAASATLLHAL
jgi:hypothetical protein